MSNSNKNKTAIVTGGTSGIGLAIVELFRQKGITTISVSRHQYSSEHHIQCDVSDEKSVKILINKVIKDYQKIDILVNNAGISSVGDIKEISLNEWNEVIKINLTGPFLCSKYVLSHMQERKQGKIVNIASIAGRHRSVTASVAYTCSKYGMIGMWIYHIMFRLVSANSNLIICQERLSKKKNYHSWRNYCGFVISDSILCVFT